MVSPRISTVPSLSNQSSTCALPPPSNSLPGFLVTDRSLWACRLAYTHLVLPLESVKCGRREMVEDYRICDRPTSAGEAREKKRNQQEKAPTAELCPLSFPLVQQLTCPTYNGEEGRQHKMRRRGKESKWTAYFHPVHPFLPLYLSGSKSPHTTKQFVVLPLTPPSKPVFTGLKGCKGTANG